MALLMLRKAIPVSLGGFINRSQIVQGPSCGVPSRKGVGPAIYLRLARAGQGLARVCVPPCVGGRSAACGW